MKGQPGRSRASSDSATASLLRIPALAAATASQSASQYKTTIEAKGSSQNGKMIVTPTHAFVEAEAYAVAGWLLQGSGGIDN